MRKRTSKRGYILLLFLTVMAIGLILASSILVLQANVYRAAKHQSDGKDATYLAEAGIDKAYQTFTTNTSYSGETFSLNGQNVTTSIQPGATANEKFIVASSTVNGTFRQYRAKLVASSSGVAVAFNYAMQAGTSGFDIGNNSILNGSVYSNGNITGGNGSRINGGAKAVGTISSPNPLVSPGPKLSGQPLEPLPVFDAAFWKAKAQEGGTITGDYTPADNSTLGPKYITGNLTFGNNVRVTISGPIYVDGSISFGNSPVLTADGSLGSQGSMLVTEQSLSLGNSITINNNNNGGYLLLATVSTDGISIGNGATAINGPLYAPNGTISVGNNARAVAFTGKGISTGNGTIVTYDEGLADASFGTGATGGWTLQKGSFQEF